MKRIGLVGGVSPESTAIYYRYLNEAANVRYGGDRSAEILIYSLDFGRMVGLYTNADWDEFGQNIVEAARILDNAGSQVIAIASNTCNLAGAKVESAVSAQFISLLDALCEAMAKQNVLRPLLLGTPFVMEGHFYRPTLKEQYGIEAVIPNQEEREIVRRVIFDELVKGEVRQSSRQDYLDIIHRYEGETDAVILGCTEIGMLIEQSHTKVPAFDTTRIHAAAIADAAFAGELA